MVKTYQRLGALAALLACSQAHPFEIKGISLGMTEEALKSGPLSKGWHDVGNDKVAVVRKDGDRLVFTLGGAPTDLMVGFDGARRVSGILFQFDNKDWDRVRDAVLGKYPSVKCDLLGHCQATDAKGTLNLIKADAALWIESHATRVAREKAKAKAKKDI